MKKSIALFILIIMLCVPFCTLAASDTAESDITVSSDAVISDENNLVENGDFGDGENGWIYYAYRMDDGSSIEAVNDEEKGDCLYVYAPYDNDVRAIQTVSVQPDSYYRISAVVKTKGVEHGNGACISVEDIHGAYSTALMGDNSWTELTLCGITGKDQTTLKISLRIGGYSADSSGEAWFDDVRVEKLEQAPKDAIKFYTESVAQNNNDANTDVQEKEDDGTNTVIAVCVASIVILAVIYFVLTNRKSKSTDIHKTAMPKSAEEKILKRTDTKLHFTRIDTVFITVLTLLYACVALVNLGTTQAPTTAWTGSSGSESVTIHFDGETKIDEIYIFGAVLGGVDEGGTVRLEDDKGNEIASYEQIYRDMYRWKEISISPLTTESVTITPTGSEVNFKEIAFFDADGNHIFGTAQGDGKFLTDEPEQIPDEFSCINGMYFDELYHGRTAYEHLNFLESYENSHPPLGKLIISIGIGLFGMNAFGWRIMGVIFGIAMVPILYCFAKYVFKDSKYALVAAALFAFDFMHFTQTRIATIDVYGVFFILLMFFFMYKYFTMSFYRDGLLRTLLPLGLAGIFFGLGAASKWICFYAGAGLAVLLLISFIQRFSEYLKYKDSANTEIANRVRAFWKNVFITVGFCVVFFIAIPAVIYCLSYLRYPDVVEAFKTDGIIGYVKRVWYYQDFMFGYHSGLEATHTYQSTWYEWMLDSRPIWYAISYFDNSYVATISAMGNPIVWWLALVGTCGLVVQVIRGKVRETTPVIMIFIGVLCNLLPWMVISRCAFIYHYFATVPFIILGALYFLKTLEEEHAWMSYFKWVWLGVALVLFGMFFPVIAGLKIPESYALNLEWMRSWWFVRNEAAPSVNGLQNGITQGMINGSITVCIIIAVFAVTGYISYRWHKEGNELTKYM